MEDFERRTGQFVRAIVAACRGDLKARANASHLFGQMVEDAATVPMAQSLMSIIVGLRDREALTSKLEGEPAVLVNRILDQLNT